MCTPGVLTPSNVMREVNEVSLQSLANWLYIPQSIEEKIRQRFPNEMEQRKQLIYYWINTDPLASWRRLIRALDKIRQSHLADYIRPNAEPLTGSHHAILHHWYKQCWFDSVGLCAVMFLLPPDTSLTPRTLLRALSTVRDFWNSGLLFFFGIPYPVLDQIRDSSSYASEDEKRMAVLQYCLQTVPGVSWGRIAGVLWSQEEHAALEMVRHYLPLKPGEYTLYRVNIVVLLINIHLLNYSCISTYMH